MRPSRLLAALLAGVSLVALAPPASAASNAKKPAKTADAKRAEAKAYFDAGADLYDKGDYEGAIASWQMSYDLSKKPLIFESMSNAYERLGDAKKAREYLARWREAAPEAERPRLDERLKNLDARIAREEEAEQARKAEEAARRAREKKALAPPPPKAEPGPPLLGLGLVGVGSIAVAVGVTLDVVAAGKRPDASSVCKDAAGSTLCLASSRDAIASSSTLAVAGDVTWILGGIAAASGAALLLFGGSHAGAAKAEARRTIVVPIVTPGGAGVGLSGSL
jgi:tetratricopeptide (TPR) repeat protein